MGLTLSHCREGQRGSIQVDGEELVSGRSPGPNVAVNTKDMVYIGEYPAGCRDRPGKEWQPSALQSGLLAALTHRHAPLPQVVPQMWPRSPEPSSPLGSQAVSRIWCCTQPGLEAHPHSPWTCSIVPKQGPTHVPAPHRHPPPFHGLLGNTQPDNVEYIIINIIMTFCKRLRQCHACCYHPGLDWRVGAPAPPRVWAEPQGWWAGQVDWKRFSSEGHWDLKSGW